MSRKTMSCFQELTVRENITYAAKTRLPRWTTAQQQEFIDAVIDVLELKQVSDNLCGNEISGGQRKRVNIGMELATVPSALFLDEPTSGLGIFNVSDFFLLDIIS